MWNEVVNVASFVAMGTLTLMAILFILAIGAFFVLNSIQKSGEKQKVGKGN